MDENQVKHTTVETYAADMARVIEDDKGGVIKKIIQEQEQAEYESKNLSPESKRNQFYMYMGMVLMVLALGTISYLAFRTKINTVPVVEPVPALIFNDKNSFLDITTLTKDQIISSITNETNTSDLKVGGVEEIYLTENKNTIGLRRTLALLGSSFAPGDTSLVYDNFMIGIVNDNARDLFVLLKTRSHIDIFQPLQDWEGKMFTELHKLFGLSMTPDNKYLLSTSFQDGVIDNKNARILYDKDGDIAIMYVFLDDNSVVITKSQSAAHEVLLRLLSSQVKK